MKRNETNLLRVEKRKRTNGIMDEEKMKKRSGKIVESI